MYLRYHAGRSFRHAGTAIAEGALVVAIGATLVFGVAMVGGGDPGGAATALAGRTAPYSTIDLASSTQRVADNLARGSKVAFNTQVYGLRGTEYPMVYVECYSVDNGSLLYGQLDHPDAVFVLGGGWSPWYDVSPSPSAKCYAHLYSYGGKTKAGGDVIRELTDPAQPVLDFAAAGS